MSQLPGRGPGFLQRLPAYRTRVASSRQLTPSTWAVEIEKPEAFEFRPTQFTFLHLSTPHGPDGRPMSLASSPTRGRLEYAVRISDSAFKQAFVALRTGDEVVVRGPIGDFVLREDRPAVLIAGGIGITPLKGMAEYAADRRLETPIRLLYSNRDAGEIAYLAELEVLTQSNPHFAIAHTLTRSGPDPHWVGGVGRIGPSAVRDAAIGLDSPVYYVSGTPAMVADLRHLLDVQGVLRENVVSEAFRGYW